MSLVFFIPSCYQHHSIMYLYTKMHFSIFEIQAYFICQDNWWLFKNENDGLNGGNRAAGFTSMNYLQRLQITRELLSIWYFPWFDSKYILGNGLTVFQDKYW